MPLWLDDLALAAVDAVYARGRCRAPPRERLAACRIVSHRGERGDGARENTYAAFDALRGSGVHGLELDVRWTRDLVPVVFHDADLRRVFGEPDRIADLDWNTLRSRHPEVPHLADFVRRYSPEFHLMVELKHEPYPDPPLQNARLGAALAPAFEQRGTHVLSLEPGMFAMLPGIPAAATMGVARLNAATISAEALAARRAGFSCHYAVLRGHQIASHHAAGQVVGCGFPDSRAVLYRELARGVDYIFTNRAAALQQWVRETPAPRG